VPSPEERALKIISNNRYLVLATCDSDGPWAAPLAFVWLPDGGFTFYSAMQARHVCPRGTVVAGAIFDSTASSDEADGVQFSASMDEVPVSELVDVMDAYFEGSFPDPDVRARWVRDPADFQGDAPQRFYRLTVHATYVYDEESPRIDQRVEANYSEVLRIRLSR
jgi:hypothetical protein